MHWILKIALGLVAILGAFVVYYSLMFKDAMDDKCGNHVVRAAPSPDGKFKAVVFDSNCGVFGNDRQEVSVLDAKTKLANEAGNIFRADGDSKSSNGPRVQIVWKDSEHLVIKYQPKAVVNYSETQIRVSTGFLTGRTIFVTYEK